MATLLADSLSMAVNKSEHIRCIRRICQIEGGLCTTVLSRPWVGFYLTLLPGSFRFEVGGPVIASLIPKAQINLWVIKALQPNFPIVRKENIAALLVPSTSLVNHGYFIQRAPCDVQTVIRLLQDPPFVLPRLLNVWTMLINKREYSRLRLRSLSIRDNPIGQVSIRSCYNFIWTLPSLLSGSSSFPFAFGQLFHTIVRWGKPRYSLIAIYCLL